MSWGDLQYDWRPTGHNKVWEDEKSLVDKPKTQCLICSIAYIIPTEGSVVLTDHVCKITFDSINGGEYFGLQFCGVLVSKAISYNVM